MYLYVLTMTSFQQNGHRVFCALFTHSAAYLSRTIRAISALDVDRGALEAALISNDLSGNINDGDASFIRLELCSRV